MVIETMIVGGIAGLAGVFGLIYWRVGSIMSFLYSNARVQAKTTYLMTDGKLQSLIESKSLTEFLNSMAETDYAQFFEKTQKIEDIHLSIEKGFVFSLEELKEMTPSSIDPVFDAYLNFWETKIIKTFYRKKLRKTTTEKIEEKLVFPVGKIDSFIISKLKESKSIADIKVIMAQTIYKEVFEKEYKSLEEFEVALDNFVYKNFVATVNAAKIPDKKIILQIMNTKFDILNILVLIKTIARELPTEKRKTLLIENNSAFSQILEKLVEAKDISQLVEHTKKTPYFEILNEALQEFQKDNSLNHFEQKLLKYYKTFTLTQELNHFQGPFPLFSYLMKKEVEQRNLLIISKGIDAGFSSSQIKELIL